MKAKKGTSSSKNLSVSRAAPGAALKLKTKILSSSSIPANHQNIIEIEFETRGSHADLDNETIAATNRVSTRRAKRIKFFRNGDKYHAGLNIPVSNERYRSFESLFEDLTRLLRETLRIPGAVRSIYTMLGVKVLSLEELEHGQSYVCSCNNEVFKKVNYNTSGQPLSDLVLPTCSNSRFRLNKSSKSVSSQRNDAMEEDSVVHPRIVTLIRSGTRPRKMIRLLLNKRNSPSLDHVLTAITHMVRLDTGYVRKVFTLSGTEVTKLSHFFGEENVFFAYGADRVNHPNDFKLDRNEENALKALQKSVRSSGNKSLSGKAKMPVKNKNSSKVELDRTLTNDIGTRIPVGNDKWIPLSELPSTIRDRYIINDIIGDGNFAVVLCVQDKLNDDLPYALKIIDRTKHKSHLHHIDDEVRILTKIQHPHIISFLMDAHQEDYTYLVLEFVKGGDLFDAISKVTRFSEFQSRFIIKRLASAMVYLHCKGIVHRDMKPENILVEMDGMFNVVKVKLADFGLACEVKQPLFVIGGTPTYMAPEILKETGYGLKIDVWAAGVILYVLLCGFPPFLSHDDNREELTEKIINANYGFPEPYWSDISDDAEDLITHMLQADPDVRFTSEDVLDHFWTIK